MRIYVRGKSYDNSEMLDIFLVLFLCYLYEINSRYNYFYRRKVWKECVEDLKNLSDIDKSEKRGCILWEV